MAMRVLSRFAWSNRLRQTELILRNVISHDVSVFVNQYQKTFSQMDLHNQIAVADMLLFPFRAFGAFPNSIIEYLINDAMNHLRPKKMLDTEIFNSVLTSYLENDIEFNLDTFFTEMNTTNSVLNENTYRLMINIYSEIGQMDQIESFLQSKKLTMTYDDQLACITGYIVSRQPEKLKELLIKFNINENNESVQVSKARGYAILGDINNILEIFHQLKNDSPNFCFLFNEFYFLLFKANAPESNLQQILNTVKHELVDASNVIFKLNKNGFYKHSLELSAIFMKKCTSISDLIKSFNTKDCPLDIYKDFLRKIINKVTAENHNNLFFNMDYDEAFDFVSAIIGRKNFKVIITCLLNKAVVENSVLYIHNSLELGLEDIYYLNWVLQFQFIPAMIEKNIVSGTKQLIELLPQYNSVILPAVLIYHLRRGEFAEFNDLLSTKRYSDGPLGYFSDLSKLSKFICSNFNVKDIDRLIVEASKAFSQQFIKKLLHQLIMDYIISCPESDNECVKKEVALLIEKHGIVFEGYDVEFVERRLKARNKPFSKFSHLVNQSEHQQLPQHPG